MHEYKVVPAPQRAAKSKGLKTIADRFAHTLAERINAEAAGGWHFVRTETLPCEERSRLGSVRVSQQVVMIFARELGATRPDAGAALAAAQGHAAPVAEAPEPAAPAISAAPTATPVATPSPRRCAGRSRSSARAPCCGPRVRHAQNPCCAPAAPGPRTTRRADPPASRRVARRCAAQPFPFPRKKR
ncbi:hypothetical protein [Pararhodobacter aggregans]